MALAGACSMREGYVTGMLLFAPSSKSCARHRCSLDKCKLILRASKSEPSMPMEVEIFNVQALLDSSIACIVPPV